ncbi:ferritin family protein [Patescibacteria group bacterium]|nr:ferritin family protein [Patescibacteria group bacterium]MBU1673544.1 ferritin family protein [Patescibacteria group bacterium]MBU1963622.1 ferritin family protein [Patescibacteria group bacterium]
MSKKFTVKEVLEIAMEIEKNGERFYDSYEDFTKSQELEKMFSLLSNEERRHYNYYKDLAGRITEEEKEREYLGNNRQYLKTLAQESVFNEEKLAHFALEGIENDKDALEFARDIEQDSISFYGIMKKNIPSGDRDMVNKVIDEEKTHLMMVEKMLAKIK